MKQPNIAITESTPAEQNSPYERAVLFQNDFQKRFYQPILSDENINGHPAKVLSELASIPDNETVGIRCSERIAYEEPTFFIREANTHKVKRQVTDEPYISILKQAAQSVTKPMVFLRAQFCELENGNLLLEYTTGMMKGHHPDNAFDTTAYVSLIKPGESFASGIPIIHYDPWPYPGCRTPLLLTHDSILYIECGITARDNVSTTYHRIDLLGKTSDQIGQCTYTYDGTPAKTCQ